MKTLSALFLCCAAFALPAKAELVTYNFTGFVFNLQETANLGNWPPTPYLNEANFNGGKIVKGDKFKGSLTYNTKTKLEGYSSEDPFSWPRSATYRQSNVGNTMALTFEDSGLSFRLNYDTIVTFNGTPNVLTFKGTEGKYHSSIDLGGNNTLYGSLAIPSFLPPLGSFFWPGISFDDSTISVATQFTSMEWIPTTAVPEPGMYAMLLAGLACAGFTARRRQARS